MLKFWRYITSERTLLDIFFRLRGLMLIASAGAILGALLMFWTGAIHLLHGYETLIGIDTGAATTAKEAGAADSQSKVIVYILEAVDAFLFALVLMIFAYGIALGFVFHHVSERYRDYLPEWMLVEGVGQLKRTLSEVVIVVLIVIFARIIIESGGNLRWEMLVLPASIVMLSFALRLLHHEEHGHGGERGPIKLFAEDRHSTSDQPEPVDSEQEQPAVKKPTASASPSRRKFPK